MKKEQIDILAGGSSTIAGINWYFVGLHLNQVYFIINQHEYSKEDLNGWEIREYNPGRKLEELEIKKQKSMQNC